jgi:preprotein translocase subunit SecF
VLTVVGFSLRSLLLILDKARHGITARKT